MIILLIWIGIKLEADVIVKIIVLYVRMISNYTFLCLITFSPMIKKYETCVHMIGLNIKQNHKSFKLLCSPIYLLYLLLLVL